LDLKFFYFGNQCPHNCYLLARIKTIAWQERVRLELHDLSEDPRPAEEYGIFSPTMLLVNGEIRWHGPFEKELVAAMLEGEAQPKVLAVKQSEAEVRGDLTPIDPRSVLDTSATCSGTGDRGICLGKSEWVQKVLDANRLKHLGYVHSVDGKCVGGAEFLPSTMVPYPIPDKRQDNAFLTCSYISDEEKDYRSYPLRSLSEDLRGWGFRTLSVASSKDVVVPNGPMWWFEKRGFVDKGLLATEKMHGAEIRYMQLEL
jgi:hypothetical protein